MAATLDLSNVPGKRGGPYKAQAVHYPAPDKSHKVKLPSIPVCFLFNLGGIVDILLLCNMGMQDLRFESAYLAAIQPFVQPLEEESRRGGKEKLTTPENVSNVTKTRFDYGVPIRINWPAILWVTLRDQVGNLINGIVM